MTTGDPTKLERLRLLSRLLLDRPSEGVAHIRNELEIRADNILRRNSSIPARTLSDGIERLERFLGRPITTFFAEVALEAVEARVAATESAGAAQPFPHSFNADFSLSRTCYALCRALRPQTVVETGVARGVSSASVLSALAANDTGTLYSVDLPPLGVVDEAQIGSLVPEDLKGRWVLLRGSSRAILPRLIAEAQPIDIFIHDSSHTYKSMRWEYDLARRHMRRGGVLLSDDVQMNNAFTDWVKRVHPPYWDVIREDDQVTAFGIAVVP